MSFQHSLLLACLLGTATAQTVCYTGYVMDMYCIERGTLLDQASLTTLEHPADHSVHCLVDVPACEHSDYNILTLSPSQGSSTHCRAYKLDSYGKGLAVDLARSVGICSTCANTGSISQGFSATVVGTATGTGAPVPLAVSAVHQSSVTCASLGFSDTVPTEVNCAQGQYQDYIYAHGALMITSWGVLLPCGVLIAKFLKHREGALWFKIHRVNQCVGLVLCFIGFVLALYRFDVFFSGAKVDATSSYIHGVFGIIVMSIGLLQPFNAILRPHAPEEGETKTTPRLVWEILHKGAGWFAAVTAFYVMYLGTTFVPVPDDKTSFQTAYFCAIAVVILVLVGLLLDKWRHDRTTSKTTAVELHEAEPTGGDEAAPGAAEPAAAPGKGADDEPAGVKAEDALC